MVPLSEMPLVREIKYDGFIFRSKIEAKWYLLFTTLGIECYYEPETFSLNIGGRVVNYLIDFQLPELDCYVEIKLSQRPTHEECVKCYALAQETGKDVYLFYEDIGKKQTNGYKYQGGSGAFFPLQRLTQCPFCKRFDFTKLGLVGSAHTKCGCDCMELRNSDAFAIQTAVKLVRSERFGA